MNILKKRDQKGFTLIEIIAVLVILGILAAVAIPKYAGMQEDAKNAEGLGALGAASGNVHGAYGKQLIAGTVGTTNAALVAALAAATNRYTTVGDFTVTYAASGTRDILITVTAPVGRFGTPSSKIVAVLQ